MLNIGETVVFGTEGIFTIEETTQKVIGGKKTKEEISRLIENIPNSEDYWVDDHKQRKEKFNRILQSGDRQDIMALAGTIHNKQKAQLAAHKKLNASDERILREAERIISLEFAFVLNIAPDEVKDYIKNRISVSA